MSKTDSTPHLPWLDLWQYSSELPLVMAGPFAPLMAYTLSPNEWAKMMNTYARLPAAMTQSLTQDTPSD
jgi:hypothetical protein